MHMADLMEMKNYTKLIAKQSKQLEMLRRKHEKVVYMITTHLCVLYLIAGDFRWQQNMWLTG